MNKEKSFTLIEILVAIVIIGILSAFIIVGMDSIKENARIAKIRVFANSVRSLLLMNIVFEWKLNGNANDSWGLNHGTIGGSPTLITDCVESSCYRFNGSSDYVYINDNDDVFNPQTEMTAFLWMRGSVQQDSRGLFTQFNYGVGIDERTWAIRPCGVTNSKVEVRIDHLEGESTLRKNYKSFTSILDNRWHYVGFTWNNGTLKLYVDGLEEKDIVYDDSFTTIDNSNAPISVGSFHASGTPAGFFNGDIDYPILFNKAISSAQIQEKYYSGLNKMFKNNTIVLEEYIKRTGELRNSLANND